jgi:2,4-dienoyl-CoA reductase-like NADH-dependent reductase (Old Yellow Enzyme family)
MAGVALVMVEATAVTPEGRISPGDMGIWTDDHVAPLARIAAFVASQGAVPGIQLAHAGRKASTAPPWTGRGRIMPDEGGWDPVAPSPIPFSPGEPAPIELDQRHIEDLLRAWERATRRALAAGFKVIEIHAAHGYLLHEFLSPISNVRVDRYGGGLENRMRLALEVAERVRAIVPDELPVFMRISATDWAPGGWDIEQSVVLARRLGQRGIDLVDVSSGGMVPDAKIPVSKGYQVPFARRIREEADIATAAVGLITDPDHADELITSGCSDLVMLARELLRDPYWAARAYHALGDDPEWPIQYGYAIKRRPR